MKNSSSMLENRMMVERALQCALRERERESTKSDSLMGFSKSYECSPQTAYMLNNRLPAAIIAGDLQE